MKMNKGTILASIAIIMVASVFAGAGTMAYFSGTASSTGNTFRAGTLTLKISKDGNTWKNDISGGWNSPVNWAPGESFTTDIIYLKNTGNIDAMYVYMRFDSLSNTTFAKKIVAVNITEWSTGTGKWDTTTINQTVWATYWVTSCPITLYKLATVCNTGGTSSKTSMYLHTGSPPTSGPYLPAGGTAQIKMTFTLMKNTGNGYQGATCTFTVSFYATNAPPAEVDSYI